jgi:hypothetical protein
VALNKTDKSFKTLINKRFTTPDRNFYQEIGKDTINTHMREVWMNTIPEDSASAILQGYAVYYDQWILTSDPTFSTQAYYFISGSGFTPGTDSINSGWLVNEASQSYFIGDFISDKYGSSYEVKLYDSSGSQIFKTDPINWIYDYKTGVLHVADPGSGSYSTPYRVTVFKYTGLTLADPGAIPTGSISGSVGLWTGSFADGHIERVSDVKVTGSIYSNKSLSAVSASIGTLATSVANGIFQVHPVNTTVARAYSREDKIVLESIQEAGFVTSTIARPAIRVYRLNSLGLVSYTDAVSLIRNEDDNTTSDNFKIQSSTPLATRFLVDYWGNTHVSGNITLSTGSTVDGVDIDVFSSSVATQISNLETGSEGFWTSSNSHIERWGNVYISGSDQLSGFSVSGSFYVEAMSASDYFSVGIPMSKNSGDSLFADTYGLGWLTYGDGSPPFGRVEINGFELKGDQIGTPTPINWGILNVSGTAHFMGLQLTGSLESSDTAYFLGNVGIGTTPDVSDALTIEGTLSASYLYGDGLGLTGIVSSSMADWAISSSNASFATSASWAENAYWTGSQEGISRYSDVRISGSTYISESLKVGRYGNYTALLVQGEGIISSSEIGDALVVYGRQSATNPTTLGMYAKRTGTFHNTQNGEQLTELNFRTHVSTSGVAVQGYAEAGYIRIMAESDGTDYVGVVPTVSSRMELGTTTGSNFQSVTRMSIDAEGRVGIGTTNPTLIGTSLTDGLHVWNNISASNLYWSGTDLTSFSSSVSTQLTAITSSYWTGSADGTISRTSDVDINGGLNIDQAQYSNAIVMDNDRYINFNGGSSGWTFGQVSSPSNAFIAEFSELPDDIGYFYFSRGSGDKTVVGIFSGSLIVNKDQASYNPSSSFEVYGSSYMGGNINVANSASFQDYVEVNGFMHVDGGTW